EWTSWPLRVQLPSNPSSVTGVAHSRKKSSWICSAIETRWCRTLGLGFVRIAYSVTVQTAGCIGALEIRKGLDSYNAAEPVLRRPFRLGGETEGSGLAVFFNAR